MFDDKKGQMGPLFRYWQYILFSIVSVFGCIIIFHYIFNIAFKGFIYPVFVNVVTTSSIPPDVQATILANYANIPIFISICLFSVLFIILIYLVILAFRSENENVYNQL